MYLGGFHFGELHNPSAHEPIIEDRGVFERVQQRRTVSRGRQAESERLLARLGVLRCGTCGSRMVINSYSGNYRCGDTSANPCRGRAAIKTDRVEEIVLDGRASRKQQIRPADEAIERANADLDDTIRQLGELGLLGRPASQQTLEKMTTALDDAHKRPSPTTRRTRHRLPSTVDMISVGSRPRHEIGRAKPMPLASADLLVRDLMTRDLATCPRDADLASIATIMACRRVHAVFVLGDTGRPEGVVSDFDMLAGEWLGYDLEGLRTMKTITAGALMTSPLETIDMDASAKTAAARMRDGHLSRLLVVDDQADAVGVISVSDLVAPLGRERVDRRTVRDLMSPAIVTCPPETSLSAAARAMTERRSRSIVVVGASGQAVGVITGNDLLTLYNLTEPAATVSDLMRQPIVCDVDLPVRDAIDVIISNEVHRVVVTDSSVGHDAAVGILSTSDVVGEMAQEGSVWQTR